MSSSMIYCSGSFCATHQQARTTSSGFLTTAAPCSTPTSLLSANVSASFTTSTTSNHAFVHKARTVQMSREANPSKSEQLKFGIEKILCGSSNAGER